MQHREIANKMGLPKSIDKPFTPILGKEYFLNFTDLL